MKLNLSLLLFTIYVIVLLLDIGITLGQNNNNNQQLPINLLKFSSAIPQEFQQHFSVRVLARIPNARQIYLHEDKSTNRGYLFVASPGTGQINVLQLDLAGNFTVISSNTLFSTLSNSNGVTYDSENDQLYIGEIDRILKVNNALDSIKKGNFNLNFTSIKNYPADKHHGYKYIKIHKNRMYIPQGAPCNICLIQGLYGTITSFDLKNTSSEIKVEATGVRNSVGFDFDPLDENKLWFTDNGRDMLGDLQPGDELNVLDLSQQQNTAAIVPHYGFPYCHANQIPDPEFNPQKNCSGYRTPEFVLEAHTAALGMIFYRGSSKSKWPSYLQSNRTVFIAEHGSWNRNPPFGYRITTVLNVDNKTQSQYISFLEGWKYEDGTYWGRPVDLQQASSGELIISDDYSGTIYIVEYSNSNVKRDSNLSNVLCLNFFLIVLVILSIIG
ncbi:hypothetical protein ABK040_013419 [Willaertia magna]